MSKGRPGERYIVAADNMYIKELFEIIAQKAGVTPPKIGLSRAAIFALARVGEFLSIFGLKGPVNSESAHTSTRFHWYDNSKSRSQLGIQYRPAKQAIEESVQWVLDQGLIP
jgi:dihydroflavonol-4-reductase